MTKIDPTHVSRDKRSRAEPPIESDRPRLLLTAFIASILVGFFVTWYYVYPDPKESDSTTPENTASNDSAEQSAGYVEQIRPENAGNQQNPAEEIANILTPTQPVEDANAEVASKPVSKKPDTEWSADSFLDVLEEPVDNSDTAAAISDLTKQSSLQRRDPYVSSLVDEAVDLTLDSSGNTTNTRITSDQAAFDTLPSTDRTRNSVLVFNSDGSITVEKGDSLSTIARRVYGDGTKFNRIYEANKNVLNGPNHLQIGTQLKIPGLQNE